MSDHTSHKLWGGRFAVPTAAALDALNRSIGTDYRLWPFDINLSQAWAVALWGAGVLLLFGVGTTIGVLGGGRLADWRLMPSVIAIFASIVAVLGPVLYHQPVPPLRRSPRSSSGARSTRRRCASADPFLNAASDAPNLASTLNQSAFHFGNAVGAWLAAGAPGSSAGLSRADLACGRGCDRRAGRRDRLVQSRTPAAGSTSRDGKYFLQRGRRSPAGCVT